MEALGAAAASPQQTAAAGTGSGAPELCPPPVAQGPLGSLGGAPLVGSSLVGAPLVGTPLVGGPLGGGPPHVDPLKGPFNSTLVEFCGLDVNKENPLVAPSTRAPSLRAPSTEAPSIEDPATRAPSIGAPSAGATSIGAHPTGPPLRGALPTAALPTTAVPTGPLPTGALSTAALPTGALTTRAPLTGAPLLGAPLTGAALAGATSAGGPLAEAPTVTERGAPPSVVASLLDRFYGSLLAEEELLLQQEQQQLQQAATGEVQQQQTPSQDQDPQQQQEKQQQEQEQQPQQQQQQLQRQQQRRQQQRPMGRPHWRSVYTLQCKQQLLLQLQQLREVNKHQQQQQQVGAPFDGVELFMVQHHNLQGAPSRRLAAARKALMEEYGAPQDPAAAVLLQRQRRAATAAAAATAAGRQQRKSNGRHKRKGPPASLKRGPVVPLAAVKREPAAAEAAAGAAAKVSAAAAAAAAASAEGPPLTRRASRAARSAGQQQAAAATTAATAAPAAAAEDWGSTSSAVSPESAEAAAAARAAAISSLRKALGCPPGVSLSPLPHTFFCCTICSKFFSSSNLLLQHVGPHTLLSRQRVPWGPHRLLRKQVTTEGAPGGPRRLHGYNGYPWGPQRGSLSVDMGGPAAAKTKRRKEGEKQQQSLSYRGHWSHQSSSFFFLRSLSLWTGPLSEALTNAHATATMGPLEGLGETPFINGTFRLGEEAYSPMQPLADELRVYIQQVLEKIFAEFCISYLPDWSNIRIVKGDTKTPLDKEEALQQLLSNVEGTGGPQARGAHWGALRLIPGSFAIMLDPSSSVGFLFGLFGVLLQMGIVTSGGLCGLVSPASTWVFSPQGAAAPVAAAEVYVQRSSSSSSRTGGPSWGVPRRLLKPKESQRGPPKVAPRGPLKHKKGLEGGPKYPVVRPSEATEAEAAAAATAAAAAADGPFSTALQAAAAEEAAAMKARRRTPFAGVWGDICVQRHLLLLQEQMQHHLKIAQDRFKAISAAAAATAAAAAAAGTTGVAGAAGGPQGKYMGGPHSAAGEAEGPLSPLDSSSSSPTADPHRLQQQQQLKQEADDETGLSGGSAERQEGAPSSQYKRQCVRAPLLGGPPSPHGAPPSALSPSGCSRRVLRRAPRVGTMGPLFEVDNLLSLTPLGLTSAGASAVSLSVASSKLNLNAYGHRALLVGAFCLAFAGFYGTGGPPPPTTPNNNKSGRGGSGGGGPASRTLLPPALDHQRGPLLGLHAEGPPFLGPLSDATAADIKIGRAVLKVLQQRGERQAGHPTNSSSNSRSNSSSGEGFASCCMHTFEKPAANSLPELDAVALCRVCPFSVPVAVPSEGGGPPKQQQPKKAPRKRAGAPQERAHPYKGTSTERRKDTGATPTALHITRGGRRSVPSPLFDL
ncbi:hypothetical protein, conserved [Eimeria maxima]|uniref:C2H2-type domain-containing protein n=1 Tax=Eimeria maxima TaxID=5804 RepID=U6M850_EIMMA|nr:hypothetical protein, conserved [Eimeria maxima]CDJ60392.1 hypothetical protein, conserved [Eimeria maxima]